MCLPVLLRMCMPVLLRDCCTITWISSHRKESQDDPSSPWHLQLPPGDITTFNPKQHLAYNISHNHNEIIANNQPAPLHMLVCGTAGIGKSYLISTIAHTLGNTCLLAATTGMASFNIYVIAGNNV